MKTQASTASGPSNQPAGVEGLRESDLAIVSLKHTMRRHRYITFWRPDDAGYCWALSWAGRYTPEAVAAKPNYYNDGRDSFAVPFTALQRFMVPPAPKQIDGDAGPVIPNNRDIIAALKAARFISSTSESEK